VSCVLNVTHIDSGTLLGIAGDIDRSNVDRLDDALALIDRGPIEVDCSKLDFIDASGIEALADAARRHGSMTLHKPPRWLSRLVDALSYTDLLQRE